MPRIGLLFGSFNPIHNGHIAIAEQAIRDRRLAEVWLVVEPRNIYKPEIKFIDYEVRRDLVGTVANDHAKLKLYEPPTHEPGHLVRDTLANLKEFELPVVILGQDVAASLPDWEDGAIIDRQAKIYAAPRIGKVSSGMVRDNHANGKSVDDLVPAAVARHLEQLG